MDEAASEPAHGAREEAIAMLVAAGAEFDDVHVVEIGPGWLVSVRGWGAGATDATNETMDTPQEVAAALIAARTHVIAGAPEPSIEGADAQQDEEIVSRETEAEQPLQSEAELRAVAEVEALFDEGPEGEENPLNEQQEATARDDHPEPDRTSDVLWSVDDRDHADGGADREASDPIDADFTAFGEAEALEAEAQAEPLALEDLAGLVEEPEGDPRTEGPIAYAASDLDALVREKLGRVSQIARELKSALQEGWTLEEFASLQNLIVRIDRKEAPDDEPARARFVAISERSQAMSRVDAHRDALEGALEAIGKSRDYAAAAEFDPERGWP